MDLRLWIRAVLASSICAAIVAVSIVVALDWLRPARISITPATPAAIVVVIDGAVATPGMVTLEVGARLQTAIDAAGGMTVEADLSGLNLAARVGDGEHISIPHRADGQPVTSSDASPVASSGAGLINLNSATVFELDQLPGIGPVIAQRIVDFRELYGPFDSIDQLDEVDGISPGMIDNFRNRVTIDD